MDNTGALGSQLGGRLSYLLKHGFLELERLHAEQLDPFGISLRELTVLMFLAGREPGSQQEAARRLGVDRTSMVGLVDSLESKGLVVRTSDAGDRRRNIVEVTPAGRQTLGEATAASDAAEAQLLAELSGSEAATLRTLLGRIVQRDPAGQPIRQP